MASWRATASQQAQDDLDDLMSRAFPFAQQMLAAYGEFFPYAVGLGQSGEVRMFAADAGGDEQPPTTEVLHELVDGLRSERDALRAVAVTSDVRVYDSDAIRVDLEHRDGIAIRGAAPLREPQRQRRDRVRSAVRRARAGPDLGALDRSLTCRHHAALGPVREQ